MTQQKLQEVTWDRLDKRKFFVNGIFIFTGLTGCLFPLTVIKTRMMALDDVRHHKGFRGVYVTARDIVRADGYRGLYKGFGTVVGGLIPGRMMYLGILEASKKAVGSAMTSYDESLSEPFVASTSNFVAGALASLSGQLIAVPVDVVSQRQMIAKESRMSGLQMAKQIVRSDGISGLYRGVGASIMMFVPSSAIWWSSYGMYQSILWSQWDKLKGVPHHKGPVERPESHILSVQILSGVMTGCTTASITNPLDVVKTRIQTDSSGKKRGWIPTAVGIVQREGIGGFFQRRRASNDISLDLGH